MWSISSTATLMITAARLVREGSGGSMLSPLVAFRTIE